ncbi:hypothetical protein SDRG_08609 [Saprolegnia diclina VS20]|uniref:EamA domain-containing protein n=1 Tax=Saprolegnia diclina (strain VS20) TaxID=1156394 RepID=T0RNI3_SAPDV|nr:hypothetical protein SDRG_08609 [Saprolegnia diclina VS20]EQC33928.1 hypothetical protein SDRG_08609 [Saprolegnia diclina VS20]|eukprot:XP_008612723.1 hypothetical protein SDRG_08609 [Saprolegnia diclina VS20]
MAINLGVLYATTCFVIWGLFPLYWKELEAISAVQLALHRIVWSFVFLALIMCLTGQWTTFRTEVANRKILITYTLSSIFILTNWMTYVWAINAGYVVETSLGYFLTPILTVILSVLVFKEKLRKWQWVSIAIAAAGLLVVAIAYAKFPWVAITLAGSFSIYGCIKKMAPLNSLNGLMLETAIMLIPSFIYLIVVECNGTGAFGHVDTKSTLMLIGGGIVTVIPLLLFASAAQRIQFNVLGMLQYISPSLVFLLGVLVYHEPFSSTKLIGFILVWVALALYTAEGIWNQKKTSSSAKDDPADVPVAVAVAVETPRAEATETPYKSV